MMAEGLLGGQTRRGERGEESGEVGPGRKLLRQSGEEADVILKIEQASLICQPGAGSGGVSSQKPDEPFNDTHIGAGLAERFEQEGRGVERRGATSEMSKARVAERSESGGEVVIGEE